MSMNSVVVAASFRSSEPWEFKSGSDHGTVTTAVNPAFTRAYLQSVRQGPNGASGPGACELRQRGERCGDRWHGAFGENLLNLIAAPGDA